MTSEQGCLFCNQAGGEILWRDALCTVVLADEPGYPAFCRVVYAAHVREMTDLSAHDRARYMEVVFATEAALRALVHPHKINLASLGNQVPHLHWHVVARFTDDRHFPAPVWSQAQRDDAPRAFPGLAQKLAQELTARLNSG